MKYSTYWGKESTTTISRESTAQGIKVPEVSQDVLSRCEPEP